MDFDEIKDLRDWLQVARDMDALTDVSGAHWDLEIGAISQLNYRRQQPAALLFDDVPGYPSGYRVLTGSVSDAARTAMTMRLGQGFTDQELVQALVGKPGEWEQTASKFDPIAVDDAPVFENVIEGADVDLTRFPVPLWNELDGGRFIGTGCIVFTRDPDTGDVNGGSYRVQMQDEGRSVTVDAVPGKHGAQHIDKWLKREGRVPVTISFGHDPLLMIVGGTEVPQGISELNYAGAITGRPLEVVNSEITGLPIPVSSEFVVEGWLDPSFSRVEGPFAEWTGHYSGGDSPVIGLDIARVLHRDDPIILGAPPSKPPHDYSYMRTVMKSAMIQEWLVHSGVPGVKGVWADEAGGGRMFVVVAIEQRFCGHSRQVGFLTAQSPAAAYLNRWVVVVDHDVDPTDLSDVIWAMSTRCDPAADIEIMRKSWGGKRDPLLIDGPSYNSRAFVDACRPFEHFDDFPAVAVASPRLLKETYEKWGHVLGADVPVPGGASEGPTSGAVTAMTDD